MSDDQNDLLLGLGDPLPTSRRSSGFIKVPHSSDRSAYGFLPIPISIVGPTNGPTVLIMAGAHGDECESQVALTRSVAGLDPNAMTGRVIALTMANEPAARVSRRNSPIDGLNLNRSYPGDPFGSATAIIADYVERHLMPLCDVVLDLHTTSDSFSYLPCATVIHHNDPIELERRLSLAIAFGTPMVLVFNSFQERTSAGAAKRSGAVRIGTEIGGNGVVAATMEGIMRLLCWIGSLGDANAVARDSALPVIRVVNPERDYVYALRDGAFESAVQLGDVVQAGDLAGCIWDTSQPFAPPERVFFRSPGMVVCLRGLGRVIRGDCLMHLAGEPDETLIEAAHTAASSNWLDDQKVPRRRKSRAGQPRGKATQSS